MKKIILSLVLFMALSAYSATTNFWSLQKNNWNGTTIYPKNQPAKLGGWERNPTVAYDFEVLVVPEISGPKGELENVSLSFDINGGFTINPLKVVLYEQNKGPFSEATVNYDQFCGRNTLNCDPWTVVLGEQSGITANSGTVTITSPELTKYVQEVLLGNKQNTGIVLTANGHSHEVFLNISNISLNYTLKSDGNTPRKLEVNRGFGAGNYLPFSEISIVAHQAEDGYVFEKWVGDVQSIANKYSSSTVMTMPSSDARIWASYVKEGQGHELIQPKKFGLENINWNGSSHKFGGATRVGGYARGVGASYSYETLLKFELPSGVEAADAYLEITVNNGNLLSVNELNIYEQNKKTNWIESTVNYDSFCESDNNCSSWQDKVGSFRVDQVLNKTYRFSSQKLKDLINSKMINSQDLELILNSDLQSWVNDLEIGDVKLFVDIASPGVNTIASKFEVPLNYMTYSKEDYMADLYELSKTNANLKSRLDKGGRIISLSDITFDETPYPNFSSKDAFVTKVKQDFPEMTEMQILKDRSRIHDVYKTAARYKYYKQAVNVLSAPLPPSASSSDDGTSHNSEDEDKDGCTKWFFDKATYDEFWVGLWEPFSKDGVERAVSIARAAQDERFPGMGDVLTKKDAFRHSLVSALFCSENVNEYNDLDDCLEFAKDIADAHETGTAKECASDALREPRDQPMDYHNNAFGRSFLEKNSSEPCDWSVAGTCLWDHIDIASRDVLRDGLEDIAKNKSLPFTELYHLTWTGHKNTLVYFAQQWGMSDRYCGAGLTPEMDANPKTVDKDICITLDLKSTNQIQLGVIKHNEECANDKITIGMDADDNIPWNSEVSDAPNGFYLDDLGNDPVMNFCREYVGGFYPELPKSKYDYIVLRLGDECPAGSYYFARYFDNEDVLWGSNDNWSSGDISPNSLGNNTTMQFCFIPGSQTGNYFWNNENGVEVYPWSQNSGVFAKYSSDIQGTFGYIFTDDESDNKNKVHWYNTPEDIKARIKSIFDLNSDTKMRTMYLNR